MENALCRLGGTGRHIWVIQIGTFRLPCPPRLRGEGVVIRNYSLRKRANMVAICARVA